VIKSTEDSLTPGYFIQRQKAIKEDPPWRCIWAFYLALGGYEVCPSDGCGGREEERGHHRGLTEICHVIHQAAILEKQYLAATPLPSAATELRRALTRLYIPILSYLSNVKGFPEEESKFERIIKSTLAIEKFVDGALADISNRRLDIDISAVACLAEQQSHAPEDEANFVKYMRYGIVSQEY